MQLLRSLVFTLFLFFWTFFYSIFFVVACSVLPFKRRFVLARVWGRVLLAALSWICGLRYRVVGLEIGGVKLAKPVTGMVPYGNGYMMVGEGSGIFNFCNKPFDGSLGGSPPAKPIVSVSVLP